MSDKYIWEIPEELKKPHDANVNTEKIAPANEPVFYDGLTPRNDQWAESVYGESNQNLMKPIGTFDKPEDYLRNYMAINYKEQPGASDYQSFWEDPIKLARYKIAIDNLPPGMEAPSWYNKDAVDKAWAYMSAANPGRYWEEWSPLDPAHPIRSELRELGTPPLEAIPDRDWGSLTPQEIWTSYSDGTNSGLTGAMSYLINQGLGGQPLLSEAVNTALASYEPGQLDTNLTGVNGLDEQVYQSLPPWKKMLVWMGSSGTAGSAAQAGGIGAAMGLLTNGLGGLVAGGAMGAGLGAGASATQNSMPWLANALNVLDLPAEGLERIAGMISQIGVAAVEDAGDMFIRTRINGEDRGKARSEVQEQEDSLTSILNDLPSAWKASAITYETAGVSLTGGKIDTLEQAESIQLDPDQFGASALKEARSMIQNGASLEEVRAEFANRYGVTGQMYDLAGHVLADPLNLIPATGLKIGAKIAQKTGNEALQLAFKVSSSTKGWRESDGVIRTLTKTYPSLLRLNLDEAAKIPGKFGAWSRHMAGIDLDMNGAPVDHWFTPEGQAEVRKKKLFAQTPESRAEESASNILLHVGLNINDAVTPTDVTKTLTRMANTDPNVAAQVGDGSWANSAEASAAPVLMRDVAKKLPELQENLWDIHEPDRALFNNLAKASGVDIEDSVALNKFMRELAKDPDNVLAQVKRSLTEAGNTELLAVLNDPMNPLKGIDLKKRAEMFIDGRAVMTLDEYKARVTAYFLDGVEKELVKWFDIKPDKWIFRLGNTIKNTQSMLLLGMNPTYYMNNVINNVVTQAFSGVLGFDGRKANDAFWKRLGIDSPRRLSGVGAADVLIKQGASPIAEAKQADGLLGKIDGFARKINKVLPFTNLSQKAEVGSSDVATTVAGKKAWYAIHKAGVGFDKMSKPAEQTLRNMGIEPQFIYAAAENGMNIKEIEANLWDEVSYNFLSQVANPDQQRLLQDVGVYDSLSTRLQKAKNGRDIDQAFKDTADDMRKHVQAKAAIDTVTETAKWYQKVITEGSQAAYEAFDNALTRYADYWSAYQKELDDFHAGLEKVPVGRRRMLKEQFFAKADNDFKIQRLERDSTLLGVAQALIGSGSQQEIKLTDSLLTANDLHNNFFGSRKRIWQDFFNAYDGDWQATNDFTDNVKNVIGEERVTELQAQYADKWMYRAAQEANRVNYRNMNEALDDVQLDIDNLFIEMFETHYPGGRNAAIAWRAQARYLQQVMVEAEDYFRHGEDGNKLGELGATGSSVKKLIDEILGGQSLMDIENDQRGKYWKQYHQKVKQPLIADQAKASLICETNIADAASGKKPVVEQPKVKTEVKKAEPEKVFSVVEEKVEKAAVKKMEVDLKAKAQADEVRQIVQKPDKYIVNIVNKYGEKVKSISEITPDMARKAMEERARVKEEAPKVEGEKVEPAKVEIEEPEEPMVQPRTVAEIENELAYKAANLDAIAKNAHGVYNREAFAQDMVDVFKLPQEQADGVMAVLDVMADYWSKRTGKAPERWWTESIADVVEGGEGELNQVNQNYFYNTVLSDAEVEGYALALSRTPNQIVNALGAEQPKERIRLLDALYKIDPNLARKTAMETKGVLWQGADIDTPEFKNWFGDSKVVDADGKPIRVYHGSRSSETISEFRPDKTNRYYGNYFTSDKNYANEFAQNSQGWGTVYPVYVNITKPFYVDVNSNLHGAITINNKIVGFYRELTPEVVQELRSYGYDGILAKWKDNDNFEVVTFTPEQVKSVNNQGTFDPNNPNTLRQQAKGASSWIEDGRAIMHALENADVSTAIHESAHVWLRTLPGVADDDIATVTNWLKTEYKYELPDDWVTGDVNTYREAHEAFARAFEKYLQEGKAPKPELQKVFDSFKEWLTAIYRKVRGLDDVKLTDEMRALFDKWMGDEQPLPDGLDYMPKRPVGGFDPRNLRRSADDLRGTHLFQTAPPEGTPEFRNWFGDSKVVDENGKPLVVYHGSGEQITVFDKGLRGATTKAESAKKGFFFASNSEVAKGYSEYARPKNIIKLDNEYQRLEKIAQLTGRDSDWRKYEDAYLKYETAELEYSRNRSGTVTEAYLSISNPLVHDFAGEHYREISYNELVEQAVKNGNDGVILKNTYDNADGNNILADIYVVFEPNQIKSVENRGTFDPTNPNILYQEAKPIPPVQSVAGTVDSLAPPPQTSAMIEGMINEVNPVLNELHMKYLQADADTTRPRGKLADRMREGIKKANPGLSEVEIDNLLAQGTKEVQKYIRQVGQQMKGEKLATMKLGLAGRDYAILNYNQRTNFDTYMGAVFPYQFWYTRSMMNWAIRGLDRPAMLANYSRLRKLQSDLGREGLPYRLRNKSFIPMPFIPDWMGEGVYFDPLKQVFPFEQFTRPIDNILKQHNTQVKKAMSILHQWETEGEADSEAVTEALQTQSGDLWKRAMAQADIEMEENIENPFDFATSLIGTSLPIQYAYQLAMGRPERISQLPVTRFIQAMTGMANIGGPAGINIEAPIRKAVGLPEMDRYYDYRVNRMLANMAAEGVITAEQASQAIVSKTGPVFEQAQGRVAQMGGWQYLGAPLGVDFFPEGEQIDRALQKEYNNAIEKWKAGDEQALTTFFDKYPEYETQMLAWKDEGEQLKRFLISEVWDKYLALPAVHKKQVQEQFGDNFTMAFLNSDTRDYDALDTETITMWAQMLNGFVPEKKATLPLKLADEATAKAVDAYYAERKAKFGSEITEEVYQSDAYNKWRNAYLAKHPGVVEWITTEQSELYGLPAEVQQQVYQFRAMRDAYYPNIYQTQEEYFALDKETRKKYIEQHPELASYWDFREQMAGQFPKASTYIMSDQAVSNALTDQTPYQLIQITRRMSGQLYRQFMGYLYGNETLTAGAKKELKRLWEEAGEPEGDLDDWLEQAKNSL